MAGGAKEVVINTNERARSGDINRLQKFAGAARAEFLRYLLNVSSDDLDGAAAVVTEYSTAGTPLRGEVVNGLLVRPVAGALTMTIDPGVLLAIAPDAAADDSNYKHVQDPGYPAPGALALGANATGSARIDVVECSVGNVVTETDARDVYNTLTSVYAATTVTKAREDRLTYRVRAGTPGSGLPANAAGWLPLAVALVPAGATTNDAVTWWDVRPLLSDRPALMNLSKGWPELLTLELDGTGAALKGRVEAVCGGRKLGGTVRRGSPGTDADAIDSTAAANRDGTSPPTDGLYYMYLLTPGGLPRWARYTDGPSGRAPRAPRGIPVFTTVAPNAAGEPSGAITLPAALGLGGSTTSGALAAVLAYQGGTLSNPVYGRRKYNARNWTDSPAATVASSPTTSGVRTTTWTLVPGTHFPATAKRITVAFKVTWLAGGNAGVPRTLTTRVERTSTQGGGGAMNIHHEVIDVPPGFADVTYCDVLRLDVAVGSPYPSKTVPANIQLLARSADSDTGAPTTITPDHGPLYVVGWEL